MTLPDPDSLEYRFLVLSGRQSAILDALATVERLSKNLEGLDDRGVEEAHDIMVENWRGLLIWLQEAGLEVRTEIRILRGELPPEA